MLFNAAFSTLDALSNSISSDQDSFSIPNNGYYNLPPPPPPPPPHPAHSNSYISNSQFKPTSKPIQEDAFGTHLGHQAFGLTESAMIASHAPMMVPMTGLHLGPGAISCLDVHSQAMVGFYDLGSGPCMGQNIPEMQNDPMLLVNELENKMNSQNLTSL